MAEFVIRQVSKVYPGPSATKSLEEINLTIRDGEFLCILGPSGCGKSTLLEILAGLQQPTSGEIFFNQEKLQTPNPKLGFVFQDPSLYPWRTIADNVALGLEIKGIAKTERKARAEKYLAMVGLQGFENKYPHQLSGGMRQRAGIARALVNNPEVLLMDEPFGAVDHLTRLQLQNDLLDIWQAEKKTVVFVTHDVSEAVFLADRVVLFTPRPGKIKRNFAIKNTRPRRRDDTGLLNMQNEIYMSIYDVKTDADLEYIL
ncbi:ABC transporter ATP-binding protein [Sporomusa sp.]|uniref:ABC transporter ATP-binding protein n=1 Tax=Sporomusa sp. TaxID=2078658 RepID=UPI002D7ED022|nr:ABC transporter ATP-binding protein [Sporomusa sp.]